MAVCSAPCTISLISLVSLVFLVSALINVAITNARPSNDGSNDILYLKYIQLPTPYKGNLSEAKARLLTSTWYYSGITYCQSRPSHSNGQCKIYINENKINTIDMEPSSSFINKESSLCGQFGSIHAIVPFTTVLLVHVHVINYKINDKYITNTIDCGSYDNIYSPITKYDIDLYLWSYDSLDTQLSHGINHKYIIVHLVYYYMVYYHQLYVKQVIHILNYILLLQLLHNHMGYHQKLYVSRVVYILNHMFVLQLVYHYMKHCHQLYAMQMVYVINYMMVVHLVNMIRYFKLLNILNKHAIDSGAIDMMQEVMYMIVKDIMKL